MTEPPSAPLTSNAHTGEKNQAEPRARNEGGSAQEVGSVPRVEPPRPLGLWGSLGSGTRFVLQPAQHAWHEDGRCIAAALDVRVLRTSPIVGLLWDLGGGPTCFTPG